jgi:N utilization substance protein A
MPLQARSEFASALNQICSERGIEPEVVLETIKAAILAAYRKDYGEEEGIEIDIDPQSGEVALIKDQKNITPSGFGRIAAQTAKQVILQRIREAEKNAILEEFEGKVGTVISGMVQRINGSMVTVNLGKAEAILPPQEQVASDNYRPNQRLRFYIQGIRQGQRGEEITLSRADKGLIENLFKSEVPEIANGSVEIKSIAREAGSRTKIAVFSSQSGVDPVGSCVGQKGSRVQAVISELGEEKIDIVPFDDDLEKYITAALSPAKDMTIKLDKKQNLATVYVPNDKLSLAIGKDGQNVRLASKLTGWRIDIKEKQETATKTLKSEEKTSLKDQKLTKSKAKSKK